MDLFTSKGGTQIGAMLEALSQTEKGKNLLSTLSGKSKSVVNTTTVTKK